MPCGRIHAERCWRASPPCWPRHMSRTRRRRRSGSSSRFPQAVPPIALRRLIAEQLQASLGTAVIVENMVGAGGRIAARAVKNSPPNGRTLLFASNSQMTLQQHIYRDLGYDPFDDFAPVSQTVKTEMALAVGNTIKAHSIEDLIAWMKANPEEAIYGSPGIGTGPHFTGIEFARLSGLNLRHVPYHGTPAALPDLLAGRIPLYLALAAELLEQHRSGTIRIVATADRARSPLLPNVPLLKESGSTSTYRGGSRSTRRRARLPTSSRAWRDRSCWRQTRRTCARKFWRWDFRRPAQRRKSSEGSSATISSAGGGSSGPQVSSPRSNGTTVNRRYSLRFPIFRASIASSGFC